MRRERGLGVGPDREDEPAAVIVTTERAADESGLLVRELDLDPLVDRPECGLVDIGRQAKREDLEHGDDATVR